MFLLLKDTYFTFYFLYDFMQLGFNLSNRVTDTLESSSILIYFEMRKSIYTKQCGQMPCLNKQLTKGVAKKCSKGARKKAAEEVMEGETCELKLQNFCANAKMSPQVSTPNHCIQCQYILMDIWAACNTKFLLERF